MAAGIADDPPGIAAKKGPFPELKNDILPAYFHVLAFQDSIGADYGLRIFCCGPVKIPQTFQSALVKTMRPESRKDRNGRFV